MSDYGSAEGEPDATLSASDTRSLDPARSDQVQTFCTVSGVDAETAELVLKAHNWDFNRSVTCFLGGGGLQNQVQPILRRCSRQRKHPLLLPETLRLSRHDTKQL